MISMSNTTTSISMTYDAFGNRVSKTVTNTSGTTTTQYLVDDLNPTGYPQVVDELVGPIGSAAVQRTYTYGLQRISQDQYISNAWLLSYYQYDGGGSVRQLTNSVGRVAQVPGGKSEFSHKRWVPRVPRLWAPGIAIRCRLREHHTYSPS